MMTNREMLKAMFAGLCGEKMLLLAQASTFGRQYYHALKHPGDVHTGARRVGECVLGDEYRKIDDLVYMACMAHDVIQDADQTDGPYGFLVRARKRGSNEINTANWTRDTLLMLRKKFGEDSITEKEIGFIHEAIIWTVPHWEPALGTMIQRDLWKGLESGRWKENPTALCVAMGDLLPPGHHPETFLGSSDPLFVEEQVGIETILRKAKRQADIPKDVKDRILEALHKFDAGQAPFALGRQEAFRQETDFLPPEIRDSLRRSINRFDESAERAKWRVEDRSQLNVFRYCSQVGFKDVPTS